MIREDVPTNELCHRDGNCVKKWRRGINLMEVLVLLMQLLCGLAQDDEFFDILESHHKSILVIYTMARAFRVLLDENSTRNISDAKEPRHAIASSTEAARNGTVSDQPSAKTSKEGGADGGDVGGTAGGADCGDVGATAGGADGGDAGVKMRMEHLTLKERVD